MKEHEDRYVAVVEKDWLRSLIALTRLLWWNTSIDIWY